MHDQADRLFPVTNIPTVGMGIDGAPPPIVVDYPGDLDLVTIHLGKEHIASRGGITVHGPIDELDAQVARIADEIAEIRRERGRCGVPVGADAIPCERTAGHLGGHDPVRTLALQSDERVAVRLSERLAHPSLVESVKPVGSLEDGDLFAFPGEYQFRTFVGLDDPVGGFCRLRWSWAGMEHSSDVDPAMPVRWFTAETADRLLVEASLGERARIGAPS